MNIFIVVILTIKRPNHWQSNLTDIDLAKIYILQHFQILSKIKNIITFSSQETNMRMFSFIRFWDLIKPYMTELAFSDKIEFNGLADYPVDQIFQAFDVQVQHAWVVFFYGEDVDPFDVRSGFFCTTQDLWPAG